MGPFTFDITRMRLAGKGAYGSSVATWGELVHVVGRDGQDASGRVVVFEDAPTSEDSCLMCGNHGSNRNLQIAAHDVEAIREPLEQLCTAPVDVCSVLDTADRWERLVLDVQSNDRRCHVDLALMASGFEGPDQERLRRGLEAIEALVGAAVAVRAGPAEHRAVYGFNLILDGLIDKLRAALGPFHDQESPVFGRWYTSLDIAARRKAWGTLRAIEKERRSRPEMTLQSSRPEDPYYPSPATRYAYELHAVGSPEHLDEIEEKMRVAGLTPGVLERGPCRVPAGPDGSRARPPSALRKPAG